MNFLEVFLFMNIRIDDQCKIKKCYFKKKKKDTNSKEEKTKILRSKKDFGLKMKNLFP